MFDRPRLAPIPAMLTFICCFAPATVNAQGRNTVATLESPDDRWTVSWTTTALDRSELTQWRDTSDRWWMFAKRAEAFECVFTNHRTGQRYRKSPCHTPYSVFSPAGTHALILADRQWLLVPVDHLAEALESGKDAGVVHVVKSASPDDVGEVFAMTNTFFVGWSGTGDAFKMFEMSGKSVRSLDYRLFGARLRVIESRFRPTDEEEPSDLFRQFSRNTEWLTNLE